MKVEGGDSKGRRYRITPTSKGGVSFSDKVAGEVGGSFEECYTREEINEMLRELDDVGMMLSRFPSKDLINRYKSLVRRIVSMILENMRVKREFGFSSRSNKMFTLIEKAEKSVAELEEALEKEREKMAILNLIEEVKGCLISLLL